MAKNDYLITNSYPNFVQNPIKISNSNLTNVHLK